MKKLCLIALCTLFLANLPDKIIAQVKTWEGTIGIPTYGWEEDVNPKFWAMEGGAKGATIVRASMTFPENLGVGKSFRTETAEAWFWKGKTFLALKRPDDAILAWQNGSNSLSNPDGNDAFRNMCKMLLK
jgi:hypothetical protein